MTQPRRNPAGRPGARRPSGPPKSSRPRPRAAATPAPRPGEQRHRSRFTGRAMVMVLVLSVLTISYASSLKAYFQQRGELQQLHSQIASSEASINSLENEKAQWQDPAYLKEQARARFGYLMPGQTSYVVIGANGKPLAAQAKLSDPLTSTAKTPTAWWTTEWKSVQLAGNPPSPSSQHQPLKYLGGSKH